MTTEEGLQTKVITVLLLISGTPSGFPGMPRVTISLNSFSSLSKAVALKVCMFSISALTTSGVMHFCDIVPAVANSNAID